MITLFSSFHVLSEGVKNDRSNLERSGVAEMLEGGG
jgi:hypothetical protein